MFLFALPLHGGDDGRVLGIKVVGACLMVLTNARVVPILVSYCSAMLFPTQVACSGGLPNVDRSIGAGALVAIDTFFLLRVRAGFVGSAQDVLEFGAGCEDGRHTGLSSLLSKPVRDGKKRPVTTIRIL